MSKKDTIEVPISLIKQYHAEACEEWREKLEEQFPEIFPNLYTAGTVLVNKRTKRRVVLIEDDTAGDVYMAAIDLSTFKAVGGGFDTIYGGRPSEHEVENMLGSKLHNWIIGEKSND